MTKESPSTTEVRLVLLGDKPNISMLKVMQVYFSTINL